MPYAHRPEMYGADFASLLLINKEKLPLLLPFNDRKRASAFRFRVYGFTNALRQAGRTDDANRLSALLFRLTPNGDLEIVDRDNEFSSVIAQLMDQGAFDSTPPPPPPSPPSPPSEGEAAATPPNRTQQIDDAYAQILGWNKGARDKGARDK